MGNGGSINRSFWYLFISFAKQGLIIIKFYNYFYFYYSWKDRATGSTTEEIEKNAKALMRQYYAFLLSAVSRHIETITFEPRQAILCLRALRHDKF